MDASVQNNSAKVVTVFVIVASLFIIVTVYVLANWSAITLALPTSQNLNPVSKIAAPSSISSQATSSVPASVEPLERNASQGGGNDTGAASQGGGIGDVVRVILRSVGLNGP